MLKRSCLQNHYATTGKVDQLNPYTHHTVFDTIQGMPAVEVSSVTKTFGEITAVDDLSLSVPEGVVYGFIGPNGSGKTTTMRVIVNIFYPDSGEVRVFGEPITQTEPE